MYPTFAQFSRWAERYRCVPIWIEPELPSGNVSEWIHSLAGAQQKFFFLHSAASGPQSRYSYFALDTPRYALETNAQELFVRYTPESGVRHESLKIGNPIDRFHRWFSDFSAPRVDGLPPFWGGAVGYFGYESAGWVDAKLHSLYHGRRAKPSHLAAENFPDMEFGIFDAVGAIDHAQNRLWLVLTVTFPEGRALSPALLERIYRQGQDRLRRYAVDVQRAVRRPRAWGEFHAQGLRSNRSEAAYRLMVRRAKGHIEAGDMYQCNLSQTLAATWKGDPWALYRRLVLINPSPYAALWRSGSRWIVSASPELLFRQEDDMVETRPIAGTYPRRDQDGVLQSDAALRRDMKECAEHIMLVDLERNDLSRICQSPTVCVAEALVVERYSHVIHLVSDVRGRLAPDKTWRDTLKACFPGGTITGCPKLSSMGLIHKLEPQRRGPYTGSLGWIGFNGDMTMNILIRSLFLDKGRLCFPVGAGIVADSDPEREYHETLHKARAMIEALGTKDVSPVLRNLRGRTR